MVCMVVATCTVLSGLGPLVSPKVDPDRTSMAEYGLYLSTFMSASVMTEVCTVYVELGSLVRVA